MKNRRTKSQIDKIYKNTHSDFKGIFKGKKSIMYFDSSKGTIICPIENLPENVFQRQLKQTKP